MNLTQQQVEEIVATAKRAAQTAAERYFREQLNSRDQMACGFASTKIYGIRGNTKIGRALKAAGMRQSYDKSFELWNPSGLSVQNVDCLEAGARAAADVFKQHGFQAYAHSRLD